MQSNVDIKTLEFILAKKRKEQSGNQQPSSKSRVAGGEIQSVQKGKGEEEDIIGSSSAITKYIPGNMSQSSLSQRPSSADKIQDKSTLNSLPKAARLEKLMNSVDYKVAQAMVY